ncbi:MAG: beta-hydroxyacyl-ACP dehydratase [Firmicutes bacterium]|nr:beta-hydroxyacyl-ACP dehydratase [Bacillota bacterium]
MKYKKEELHKLLPHRDDMLLIDDVELVDDGETRRAIAHYTVRGDEFFLRGHFPDFPVVPGVILCEMMVQSCCVFFADENQTEDVTTFLTSLNNVKFRSPVRPGDTARFECTMTRQNRIFTFAEGKTFIGDKLAAAAEFSFALAPTEKVKG